VNNLPGRGDFKKPFLPGRLGWGLLDNVAIVAYIIPDIDFIIYL
jgi:hypothetical protein